MSGRRAARRRGEAVEVFDFEVGGQRAAYKSIRGATPSRQNICARASPAFVIHDEGQDFAQSGSNRPATRDRLRYGGVDPSAFALEKTAVRAKFRSET